MKNVTRIAIVALAVLTCSVNTSNAQSGGGLDSVFSGGRPTQQVQPYNNQMYQQLRTDNGMSQFQAEQIQQQRMQRQSQIQQVLGQLSPQERAMLPQVLQEFRTQTGNPYATVEDLIQFYFEVILPAEGQQQLQGQYGGGMGYNPLGSTHQQRMNNIHSIGEMNTMNFNQRSQANDAQHNAFIQSIRN